MFKSYFFFIALVLFSSCLLWSCTNSSGKVFSTKADSLQFARAVYNLYPRDVRQDGSDTSWLPGDTTGVQPIPWDTVLAYQNYYDKQPQLFTPQKLPYKGFGVDAAGYSKIIRNDKIKGLYLRLGRRADGSYTIMLLGTDSLGNILQNRNQAASAEAGAEAPSNFDHVRPCPTNCPEGDN